MGKVIARKHDASTTGSTTVSFSKDPESGYFIKTEQDTQTNLQDYSTKKIGKPRVSKELYEITDSKRAKYSFDVTGPDGKPVTLYFKRVKKKT